jgi:hypothetical protein
MSSQRWRVWASLFPLRVLASPATTLETSGQASVRVPWAYRSAGYCTLIVVPYWGGFTTT